MKEFLVKKLDGLVERGKIKTDDIKVKEYKDEVVKRKETKENKK